MDVYSHNYLTVLFLLWSSILGIGIANSREAFWIMLRFVLIYILTKNRKKHLLVLRVEHLVTVTNIGNCCPRYPTLNHLSMFRKIMRDEFGISLMSK